jgi:ribose transport system substrate-binding protein
MLVGMTLASLLLAACSSSKGGAGTGDSSSSGTGVSAAGGESALTTVYAAGIPTLQQLYASTETPPPASGPKLATGKTVYFVSCGQSAPGCSGPADAVASVGKQVGWNVKIIDGNFDVGNAYANGIRQAIAAKADAIAVHGIGCSQILQPLLEAKAAGIPVFNSEGIDCSDPKNPGGAGAPLFVDMQFNKGFPSAAEFFKEWGFLQASYIIDATKGKATILRDNYTGSVQGAYQMAGQDEALAKCNGCKVLSSVDWVPSDSGANGPLDQKFTTVLTKYPSANAAMLSYDSVATTDGVSKAILDAGRQNSMVVVGGEGYAPALQLIGSSGGLSADFGQSAAWIGWGLVDTMNRYFNKSPLVPEGIGFRLVDKSHNMPPAGTNYAPPIDFESTYLKSWGVK